MRVNHASILKPCSLSLAFVLVATLYSSINTFAQSAEFNPRTLGTTDADHHQACTDKHWPGQSIYCRQQRTVQYRRRCSAQSRRGRDRCQRRDRTGQGCVHLLVGFDQRRGRNSAHDKRHAATSVSAACSWPCGPTRSSAKGRSRSLLGQRWSGDFPRTGADSHC